VGGKKGKKGGREEGREGGRDYPTASYWMLYVGSMVGWLTFSPMALDEMVGMAWRTPRGEGFVLRLEAGACGLWAAE